MKRLISVLSAFTALKTVFSCTTLEPTNLSSDTLPVKITVTGHARYQSYNKSGNLQDPEVVDKGTEVRIYYGIPDDGGKTEFALRTVTTDADGFFSAEIGCPAGKAMTIKANCSFTAESYALNEDGKFVSTETCFFSEVEKTNVSGGDARYFQLDMLPSAYIGDEGLKQPK